jgi:hypothetical protein
LDADIEAAKKEWKTIVLSDDEDGSEDSGEVREDGSEDGSEDE